MSIKNESFRYLIIFNFIFIAIIYFDFLIPFNNTRQEKIKYFYNVVNEAPNLKGGGRFKEIKYIMECESENIYYLGKFPPEFEGIERGKDVEVLQTIMFNKTKILKIDNKSFYVSILSSKIIVYIIVFCIIANLLNIFYTNKFLDIILAFGTAPIYFIGLVYVFGY